MTKIRTKEVSLLEIKSSLCYYLSHLLMNYLTAKDFLEVCGANVISNVDLDIVSRLYQPLVGYKASMLYMTLVNYINFNEAEIVSHGNLFKIMQIVPGEFLQARKALEAVGLIKTYLKIENEIKHYIYVVYSPLSPDRFFHDPLFRWLLIKYIGEPEAGKLARHYKMKFDVSDFKDMSAEFSDVFNPDFNDVDFDRLMPEGLKGTEIIKVKSDFEIEDFFTEIKNKAMIKESAFSEEEIQYITDVAIFYGLNVKDIVPMVMEAYNESEATGKRLNFKMLKESAAYLSKFNVIQKKNDKDLHYIRLDGKIQLADKLELMERLSPRDFLVEKQGGGMLAPADLELANQLRFEMGLKNGPINALFEYVLEHHNNRLEKNYVAKIAATLKRAKITTAYDAINFLKHGKNDKSVKTKINIERRKEQKADAALAKSNEKFDQSEFDKEFEEYMRKKK